MDNEPNFIKRKVKKHTKKFSMFILIGILKSLAIVLLSWIIIDLLKVKALIASTVIITIMFFLTYLAYIKAKVIKPRFLRYTSATISFSIATIMLIWFFVDFMGFSGALSSMIVVGTLFIVRYLFFNIIGLIHHG